MDDQNPASPKFHVDSWSSTGWTVVYSPDGRAVADVARKQAMVPQGNGPGDRAARAHEGVRAALGVQQMTSDFSHALEEFRIDRIAQKSGVATEKRLDSGHGYAVVNAFHRRVRAANMRHMSALAWLDAAAVAHTQASLARGNPVRRVQIESHVADFYDRLEEGLAAADRTALADAVAALSKSPDPVTREREAARLAAVFGPGDAQRYEQQRKEGLQQAIAYARSQERGGAELEMPGDDAEAEGSGTPKGKPSGHGGKSRGGDRIGDMEIHHHVDRAHDLSPVRRPRGADDVGQVPDRWERWAEDKHVFQSRRPGGTILIDLSGSMGWDFDKLKAMIKKLPAVTIAGYSGNDIEGGGRLCILAEKGLWRGLDEGEVQFGNAVDLEALEWLAKQRGPRVWISDGYMTGGMVGKLGPARSRARAAEIAKKARIVRVADANTAMRYLRSGGSRSMRGVYRSNHSGFSI